MEISTSRIVKEMEETLGYFQELKKMTRKEMNINEDKGVQRSSDETMDKRENEEEEEMRVENPESSTTEEPKEEERRMKVKVISSFHLKAF